MAVSRHLLTPISHDGLLAPIVRSSSNDDLSTMDSIQMFVASASTRNQPVRVLGSDSIASMNVRVRGPARGFYTKQVQRMSSATGDMLTDDARNRELTISGSSQSMHLVLGLSDLLFVSVETLAGKSYRFSFDRHCVPCVGDLKQRICERDTSLNPAEEQQLVLLSPSSNAHHSHIDLDDHRDLRDLDATGSCQLHLLLRRSDSKVRATPGPGGRSIDISVVSSVEDLTVHDTTSAVQPLPFAPEDATSDSENSVDFSFVAYSSPESSAGVPTVELLAVADVARAAGPEIAALVASAELGIQSGQLPRLTADGSGGTYLMPGDKSFEGGEESFSPAPIVGVFKPMDEEPLAPNCPRPFNEVSAAGEGLKKGTRVGEGALREVAAYLLDHPHPALSTEQGFAGVPPTALIRFNDPEILRTSAPSSSSSLSEQHVPLANAPIATRTRSVGSSSDWLPSKVGSLQKFVPSVSNCEDMGPSRFPVSEVHKIAVLDIRLANADRNGANILVVEGEGKEGMRLVPIDHGYCLPETLEDVTFEWLYWQQSRRPFDQPTLDYIASLDAEEDITTLKKAGWSLRPACASILRASTMLLKKGASDGLSAYQIGSMMVRKDADEPSDLEMILDEASELAEEVEGDDDEEMNADVAFAIALETVMDSHLGLVAQRGAFV